MLPRTFGSEFLIGVCANVPNERPNILLESLVGVRTIYGLYRVADSRQRR